MEKKEFYDSFLYKIASSNYHIFLYKEIIMNLSSASPKSTMPTNAIKEASVQFQVLEKEIEKIIIGQKEVIKFISIATLCNGHVLLEGIPGVAKTTIIKAITNALGLSFKRIQFTPDLLPSDLIGSLIYNQKTQEFDTKKGPIFSNLILADEINRAPAKVQAALLEAMQEQQVTIGSETFYLDKPFLVFATQNPIEQEGTYRLPEAQVDRFMYKIIVKYPTIEEERSLLNRNLNTSQVRQVISYEQLCNAQAMVNTIYVDDKIMDYIVRIVFATRTPELYNLKNIKPFIEYGASPRATLALYHAAQGHAFLEGQHFVTPDNIKAVAPAVLRHRIPLTYQAQAQNIAVDQIIKEILATIHTP